MKLEAYFYKYKRLLAKRFFKLRMTKYKKSFPASTKYSGIPEIQHYKRENLILGENCIINYCYINTRGVIKIGDNVTISRDVSIIASGYDPQKFIKNGCTDHVAQGITIGNNVWIGHGATILDGVTLTNNIIIGAKALVSRSCLETNCIYVGVPAEKVKEYK